MAENPAVEKDIRTKRERVEAEVRKANESRPDRPLRLVGNVIRPIGKV